MDGVCREVTQGGMPEVAFPKWQKEKVERRDFSLVCLLKGLGTLNEISRQQVWRKQGGMHVFPSTCWGCPALQHRLVRVPGTEMGAQKGYRKSWMESLLRAITYQETVISHGSGILLILGCQKLVRSAQGGLPVLMVWPYIWRQAAAKMNSWFGSVRPSLCLSFC